MLKKMFRHFDNYYYQHILTVGYRGVEVHYNLQMTILIVTDSIPLVVRDGDDEFT